MASCAVRWCGKSAKTSNKKKDGITFHRFPKCPEKKKQWIEKTYRGEEWFPRNNSVICSRHFTEDNFHVMNDRRRLLDSAIPTLYLPILLPDPSTAYSSSDTLVKNTDTPLDDTTSKNLISDSPIIVTPTNQRQRLSFILGTPSTYDIPVKKRLCRRIIELTNVVKMKNKKIKKLSDSNRRLKRQIHSLKSLLPELENKNFITAENIDILKSIKVKCNEIIHQ